MTKVIVCKNGVFGGRMLENVKRTGGVPVVVDDAWGAPVSPDKVCDAFKANPDAKILAFVHAETSTGTQSDAQTLGKIAQEFGALTIMDCVTSLGGTPLYMDQWGIDAVYSAARNVCRARRGCPRCRFPNARSPSCARAARRYKAGFST